MDVDMQHDIYTYIYYILDMYIYTYFLNIMCKYTTIQSYIYVFLYIYISLCANIGEMSTLC